MKKLIFIFLAFFFILTPSFVFGQTIQFATTTSFGLESAASVDFQVVLSAVSGATTTVDYAVTGGTATGGGVDYTLIAGTLIIPAGSTSTNITAAIINDLLYEFDETIIIALSSSTNAVLGANITHTYAIWNNDFALIQFAATFSSGSESVSPVDFQVVLLTASGLNATVDYAVTGGTATGGGVDYTLIAGTLTIPAGSTSTNITAAIIDDLLLELDETIIITLSNPTNAVLGANITHTYTIINNDATPTVQFAIAFSSGSENISPVNFQVVLSAVSGVTTTADYAVAGSTATYGVDYTLPSLPPGTLTIPAGSTSTNITAAIINDLLLELDETIVITLFNPTDAVLGANNPHTHTILNNDPIPTVQFATTFSSGSENTSPVNFQVVLSDVSGAITTVDYAVTGGTATGGGKDYTLFSGTLFIPAGLTSTNITAAIIDDLLLELDETIIITLSTSINAVLGANTTHTYTILNNDTAPTVQFAIAFSSGLESVSPVNFQVVLSATSTQDVTVDCTTAGSTATFGVDYTLPSTLTILAGSTSTNITAAIINDLLYEPDETIIITLSNPTNAVLGANITHTYTILNDDAPSAPPSTEVGYPAVPGVTPPTATTTFPEYVKYLFNFSIMIAGLIALGVIIWGGVLYFTSRGNPQQIDEAKKKIIGAFFGLVILLSAYLILVTINPQLTILSLPFLTPATTTSSTFTSTIATSTFQEIPIGTLVENVLAKNISCFDYGAPNVAGIAKIDLIDCRNKGFISTADSAAFATTTFFPNTSTTELFGTTTISGVLTYYYSSTTKIYSTSTPIYYCYDYDLDGNKKELLEYHDRYDCIKNLLEAMKIKNEKLKTLVSELKVLSGDLKDESLQLKTFAENCNCANGCSWSCAGCGCNNSGCACSGCSNSSDNCPDRAAMNTLRKVTIPNLIEQIEKKRIEIYAFIYGAATSTASYTIRWYGNDDSYTTTTAIHYLSAWDPATTTTFLTFEEGLGRLNSFISNLNQDLIDLRDAEELMKYPYGDRLTLVEFLDVKDKSKEVINALRFRSYDIALDYCRDIKCTATNADGICNKCQINPDRLCNRYVSSGDNATFYENEKYLEEETFTKEKCTVDPKKEKGIPLGLIPIGETVDGAEEFASSIIWELRKIWNNSVSIKDNALDARENARLQIVKVYELIELTSQGNNNTKDCVVNCQNVPCSCSCRCFGCGSCGCCSEYCGCSPFYCINCRPCSGTVCPWGAITSTYNSILSYYNRISTNLSDTATALTNIIISIQRYTDLTEAINLLPGDPNKCTIFDKLAISRQKLTKCFTGYETPQNIGMTKMRVFSSKIALDLVYLGKLIILPVFPNPASTTVLNAYPFNSDKLTPAQKLTCLTNKDSIACQTIIRDLMDNYYCCGGK